MRLLGLIFLVGLSPVKSASTNTTVISGTLIVIGSTETDLIIAADSRATWRIGSPETGPKIFKIGQFSACTLTYDVAVTISERGQTVDKIDFVELLKQWISQHRQIQVTTTHKSLVSLYSERIEDFYARHRHSPPIHVGLVCLGYDSGTPVAAATDIYSPASPKSKPFIHGNVENPKPGFLVPLGESQVCNNLLQDNSLLFPAFRNLTPVEEYHNLKRNGYLGMILTDDLLGVAKVCLEATESKEALKFDPHASLVGPPNHYAVISRATGFREVPLP